MAGLNLVCNKMSSTWARTFLISASGKELQGHAGPDSTFAFVTFPVLLTATSTINLPSIPAATASGDILNSGELMARAGESSPV